jgi:hypothetical protein
MEQVALPSQSLGFCHFVITNYNKLKYLIPNSITSIPNSVKFDVGSKIKWKTLYSHCLFTSLPF